MFSALQGAGEAARCERQPDHGHDEEHPRQDAEIPEVGTLREDATYDVYEVAKRVHRRQVPKRCRHRMDGVQEAGQDDGRQEEHAHREERFRRGGTDGRDVQSDGKPSEDK